MADLESVLARIPGLAGYLAQKRYDDERSTGQIQQAGGLLGLKNAIDTQNESQQVRGILAASPDTETAISQLQKTPTGITAASHLQALDTARRNAALTAQMGDLSRLQPEQLDALGGRLAVQGHPGAATVMNIADRRRKEAADAGVLSSMRSQGPVGEQGPQIPQEGVVPQFLLQDPQFGPSAKALMDRINRGAITTTSGVESELSKLTSAYNATQTSKALVEARGEQARKTKEAGPGEVALTPAGMKVAEELARAGKTLPGGWSKTGMSRGNAILNSMGASQEGGAGSGSIVAAQADYAANRSSLQQLVKRSDALEQSSKKIDKDIITLHNFLESGTAGGVRLTNTPINKLREQFSDPKLGQLIIAAQIVGTEYERMINGGLLSIAQLHEGAREDAQRLINANMTPQEMRARLGVMVQEIGNQRNAFKEQISEVKGRTSSSAGGSSVSSPALPSGIPTGSKLIGKSPQGADVYQSPDGKKWVP